MVQVSVPCSMATGEGNQGVVYGDMVPADLARRPDSFLRRTGSGLIPDIPSIDAAGLRDAAGLDNVSQIVYY